MVFERHPQRFHSRNPLAPVMRGAIPTDRAILISLDYIRTGLWALAGVILIAAGAVAGNNGTGIGVFAGATLGIFGVGVLAYAAYRMNELYKEEEQLKRYGEVTQSVPSGVQYSFTHRQ